MVFSRRAFTLIELLVVIAIIAILAVVVVLTLNPEELLRRSRDANRVSDMATLTNALNLYTTDQAGASTFSLGSTASTGISIYDPGGSSTCGNLGLPPLGSSSWYCGSSTSSRSVNGQGWIPVNFSNISAGSPIGSLPVDPANQTSSGLFYAYNTNGTQFQATANLESQKYKTQYGNDPQTNYFPGVISGGTQGISALYNSSGLVGSWLLNEGSGTIALDASGNNYNGTWSGTKSGLNSTYYGTGSLEAWAGYFNGSDDYVDMGTSVNPSGPAGMTITVWIDPSSYTATNGYLINKGADYPTYNAYGLGVTTGVTMHSVFFWTYGSNTYQSSGVGNVAPTGRWTFVAVTVSGDTQGSPAAIYINGSLVSSFTIGNNIPPSTLDFRIGQQDRSVYDYPYTGYINDVRAYNRVLSAAEIQALYNSQN